MSKSSKRKVDVNDNHELFDRPPPAPALRDRRMTIAGPLSSVYAFRAATAGFGAGAAGAFGSGHGRGSSEDRVHEVFSAYVTEVALVRLANSAAERIRRDIDEQLTRMQIEKDTLSEKIAYLKNSMASTTCLHVAENWVRNEMQELSALRNDAALMQSESFHMLTQGIKTSLNSLSCQNVQPVTVGKGIGRIEDSVQKFRDERSRMSLQYDLQTCQHFTRDCLAEVVKSFPRNCEECKSLEQMKSESASLFTHHFSSLLL